MNSSYPMTPIAALSERISPLRGEFVEPTMEAAFLADRQAAVVQQQRLGLVIWAVLMVVFAVPDWAALGNVTAFWALTVYRVVFAVLLVLAMLALARRPALADGSMMMWLALVGYPFFFLVYFLRPDIRALNTGMVMVIQLTLFLFMPVRVAFTVWVALFGALGAAVSVGFSGADLVAKIGTAFLVVMPGIVGYASALRLQKTERQEFCLRRQLQDANRELQAEVQQRIALQAELALQAATDPLTGLANRRALAQRYAADAARARRTQEPLSLALMDLDHFKRINDSQGHAGGDAVLQHIGALGARSFRCLDMAARVGGEEFAILLPGAPLDHAAVVMQRFLALLEATPAQVAGQSVPVSATVGVAEQRTGESLEDLLARADAAMYAGKQAGRARVVLAPHEAQSQGNGGAPTG